MVEEWRRRHLKSFDSEIDSPLYVYCPPSASETPRQSERMPYVPPSLESVPRFPGVFDSDETFKYVATSMLLLYENHKLSADDAIKGILVPEERRAFSEILSYRFSRLPVFPEAGESSVDGLVRRAHGIFGATLEALKNVPYDPPLDLLSESEPIQQSGRQPREMGFRGQIHSTNNVAVAAHYPTSKHQTQPISPRRPSPLKEWLYDTRDDWDDVDRPKSSSRRNRDRHRSPRRKERSKGQQRIEKHEREDEIPLYAVKTSGSRKARNHFFPDSPTTPKITLDPSGIHCKQAPPIRVDIDWNINQKPEFFQQQSNDVRNQFVGSLKSPSIASSKDIEPKGNLHPSEATIKTNSVTSASDKRVDWSVHSQLTGETSKPSHVDSESIKKPSADENISLTQWEQLPADSPESANTQRTIKTKTTASGTVWPEKSKSSEIATPGIADWDLSPMSKQQPTKISQKEDGTVDSNKSTIGNLISWASKAISSTSAVSTVTAKPASPVAAATDRLQETDPPNEEEEEKETDESTNEYQIEIARRKGELWRTEAEALQQQSFLWKDVTDEILDVSEKIQSITNRAEREAYELYRKELQSELERMRLSYAPELHGYERHNIPRANSKDDGSDSSSDKYSIQQKLSSDPKITPPKQQNVNVSQSQVVIIEPSLEKTNRVVSVVAPRALPEGYKFEARIGNEVFLAKVPRGGVAPGEIFASRMYSIYDEDNYPDRGSVFKDMDSPDSRWRDELFDCFHHGFLHPFLLNTLFCPHVSLVQIMSRLGLTCTGDKVKRLRARSRARNLVLFTVLVIGVHIAYFIYPAYVAVPLDRFLIATMPLIAMDLGLLIYFLYLVAYTRGTIRREYGIVEYRCRGCEDACLAVFCTCCTIGQMGRHTADYETYRAYCCTDTGLAKHIEVMV